MKEARGVVYAASEFHLTFQPDRKQRLQSSVRLAKRRDLDTEATWGHADRPFHAFHCRIRQDPAWKLDAKISITFLQTRTEPHSDPREESIYRERITRDAA